MFRKNKALFALLGALFLFYFQMMSRSVTLEDSGELLTVASSFGIAHPPGYPLFGMIGGLFGLLPTGNFAMNIHFMSAFFGLLTLWMAHRVAMLITNHRAASLFGVALAGLVPTITWYFTVAEVYSQFTFLFLCCLYLVIKNERTEWLALLIGLGFCSHWPLFILAGPALVIARPQLAAKIRPRHILFFILGLSPVLFLYFRSLWGTPFLTTGSADNLTALLDLISRKFYHKVEKADAAGMRDEILYFTHSCSLIWRNYWWLGTALAGLGVGSLLARRKLALGLALLWLMFGINLVMRIFFRAGYDILFGEELEQFHVLPLLGFGLAAACGASVLYQWFPRRRMIVNLVLALSVGGLFVRNFNQYELPAQNSFASEVAKLYLSLAPPNSIYLLNGDPDMGPFTFISRVEKFRPDVTVYAQSGFLVRPEEVAYTPGYEERLAQFLRGQISQGKSVVYHRIYPQMERELIGFEKHDYEILTEVAATGHFTGLPANAMSAVISFADRYASGEIKTGRWKYHQESLLGPLCRYLARNKVEHAIFKTTVYCQYYRLRDWPPADPAVAASMAMELWQAAEYFPADEKATIEKLVKSYLPN